MRFATTPILAALVIIPLLAGCGGSDEAERAYRAGRFEEASAAFARIEADDPEDAPVSLLYNRALAALRAGELGVAEAAVERASALGDAEVEPHLEFLRGNIAFAQCELAELQARTPEAEPFAFDVAITFGEKAQSWWRRAAARGEAWPEAGRNVERAHRMLEELRRGKAERLGQKPPGRQPKPRPRLLPPGATPDDDPGGTSEEEAGPEAQITELPPEAVSALFGKLGEKEREKIRIRRAHRRARTAGVEKDW